MMMMIVMIMIDDNDDGNNHGECRVQTKITLGIPGRQIAGASRTWAKVFRIKQIVESTFLTSENVKYDLERDITCFEVIDWIQLENNS